LDSGSIVLAGTDTGENFIDFNGNNLYDVAEVYTDENGNGKYDTAESYTDSNENGSYDYAEVYVDSNANGVYDADEPFEDADGDGVYDYAEPYTDADGDGVYDADEPFEDADGNGVYDVAESFDDVNDNGVRDGSDVMPYFNEAFIEGANDDYAAYGKVYNNVAFDFAYNDESGYFEYDSTRAQYATRVSYNQATGFYMDYYNYDEINYQNITDAEGVKKADADWEDVNGSSQTVYQFYPFNSPLTNDRFATENLMFGMKLNIPFNMFKAEEKRNESMFKFSGDDDVWVYVDNQQVLDIGGTHTAVGGVIDLKHGYALTGSSFSADTGEADSSFAVTNSGTAVGVTDIEKAAFAIASSAKITEDGRTFEVGFDPDRQNTPINITAAEFFDDSYVPADASKPMQYEYVIDEANEVIKIKFSNVKKADGSLLKDSNENKVTEGYAVLRLTKFTLRDDGVSGDIQEHDLDIYYLERGLNSSNFKLAFNFVENTERTVEKKWADGAENHTDPDESVTVELYRTEPQVIENSTFTFPSGNTMIRAVSNKADGTTAENSAFAKTSDAVMVQYKVANSVDDKVDGAVVENGAVTLSFNGMLLNKDLFTQLSNDTRVNLKITINGTAVKADDFLASVGNLTYENGELEDGTSATATEAADMVYLKLPYNSENPLEQNRSIIQISFNPSEKFSATANDTGSAWKLNGGSNGWLLEASAYNADTGARVTVAEQKIPTHTSNKTLLVPEIVTDGVITQAARELNADDMRFVIYRTLTTSNVDNNQRPDGDKVYTTYDDYDYRYNVNVIHKNDIITYTDAVHTSSTRGVVVERGEDVLVQGAFGSGKNLVIQVGSDQTLLDSSASVQVATEDDVILDVYAKGDNNRYYSMEPDDTAVKRTDAESLIAYSDAYLVGKPVVLKHTDDIDNWKYVWDNIIEGITVEGELKEYRYFIRETKVTDAEGRDVTSQYTSQYEDADGNIIQPSYISVAGYADPLKLYSIDNAAKFAAVRNIPSTDLQLKKVWSAAAVKQEETGVQIDIYSTTGTPDLFDDRNNNGVCDYAEVDPVTNEVITPTELLVDHNQNSVYDGVAGEHVTTVTLMPDTQATNEATDPNDLIWKKTVQNLPLYKQVGSEWVKLNYYAVEHSMTYTATEDGTEVQKKYLVSYTPDQGAAIFNLDEGETALVYPVRMGDDENPTATLTVTNRPDNAGAFELKLYKYEAPYDPSSEENIPIKNAEFSLQRRQVEKAVDPVTNEVTYTALTDWSDVDSSMKILTDENGVYTIPAIDNTNGDELVIYQYKLQEVAVPLIYVKDSTEIYFTVETLEDKVIDYVVAAGPTGDLLYSQSWDPDTLSLELILQNEPIEIVIPNTGGGGDTLFRIGGTVSMILFLIGMELRRRKYSA
ncbi:MAG: fibro-slime domain-containing protein, partial [Ruminococcus sp.]|nr:fibro-slime domain-containing protein [Ruminococcus sp.]